MACEKSLISFSKPSILMNDEISKSMEKFEQYSVTQQLAYETCQNCVKKKYTQFKTALCICSTPHFTKSAKCSNRYRPWIDSKKKQNSIFAQWIGSAMHSPQPHSSTKPQQTKCWVLNQSANTIDWIDSNQLQVSLESPLLQRFAKYLCVLYSNIWTLSLK